MIKKTTRTWLACGAAALALTWGVNAVAQVRRFEIPAQDAARSIPEFGRQAGLQITAPVSQLRGVQTPAVRGDLDARVALARLLQGTGLEVAADVGGVITLRRAARPQAIPATETVAGEPAEVTELTVTGTNIRGAPSPSPLLVLDRADIEDTGHGTLVGALSTLPQVFGGQATEGTLATRADLAGSNSTFATSVNLRGLGPSATLVLVNGRRVSGAGFKGDFVDLTTIPTVAVERVEILLDGASAIYGADAVGGVVNVILRKSYNGLELRARVGGATAGEPLEGQLGLAFGRTWASGGLFAAYEGYRRTALMAEDREITASADLRPFGGSDRRETFSFPGNILGLNPATGLSGPLYGIPADQNGLGLTAASFQAGVINRQTPQLGLAILPDQRQHTLYAAAWQELTDRVEVSGDLRWAFRRAEAPALPGISTLTVSRANPYFVSPTGAATQQIAYSFAGELGATPSYRRVDSLTATLAADVRLPAEWRAGGYLGVSREQDSADVFGAVNSAILAEALGNVPDRPETPYSPSRDGYFNPYTGLRSNPAAVLAAIGSGFTLLDSWTETLTANLQADGAVFRAPAGDVRLAVGGQARRESFATRGANYVSTLAPTPTAALDGEREVLALFSEMRAPVLSAASPLGALELSLAGRAERYSDFGRAWSPKLGLLWTPSDTLKLRGTYGRSFRAPALRDLFAAGFNSVITISTPAGTVPILTRQGGNPGLEPETATSWTIGGDFTPEAIQGLRISATWFQTHFKDRIDRPAASNISATLTDPRFGPFVQRLDPRTNAADLQVIRQMLADPATRVTTVAPEAIVGIVDLRFVNTGALTVRGIDLQAAYRRPVRYGELGFTANATWLQDYEQQLTPTAETRDVVGRVGLPADFRARAAADWRVGPFSTGLAANYTSHFEDFAGVRIDDLVTWDAQAGWAPQDGAPEGLSLRLTVRNLLDTKPPFYDNPFGFAYDPASGDPIGRFVALQLTRNW